MLHPATKLQSVRGEIGVGVIATAAILRGTITWARDPLDRVLTPAQVARLPAPCIADIERYTWRDAAGNQILSWDLARFVNHSCDPNCLAAPGGCEIAVRDIAAGEEITNDYANLGMLDAERFRCYCASRRCRGFVGSGDAANFARGWHDLVIAALPAVPLVSQPLWNLLGAATRKALQAAPPAARPADPGAPEGR